MLVSTNQLPTYQRMYEYMSSHTEEVMVNTTIEGIAKVRNSRGGYAFILGKSPSDNHIPQYSSGCSDVNGQCTMSLIICRFTNKRI